MNRSDCWPTEDDVTLRQLWAEGLKGVEIATRMGRTKNAIVGRAHRLNLPGRPSPIKRSVPRIPAKPCQSPEARRDRYARKRDGITSPKPNRNTVPVLPRPKSVELPARRRLSSVVLPVGKQQCKWPIGHPNEADFHFCTDKALIGKPYCAPHCAKAFVTPGAEYEAGQTAEAAD